MTRHMDARDLRKAAYILENVRTGNPTTWRNTTTGNEFTLTPTRTQQSPTGPCRHYTTDAYIDGGRTKFSGTACRLANGTWRFVRAAAP
jgi:surface antigen